MKKRVPISGVEIFYDELAVKKEDAGVQAWEMFIVEGKVIRLSASKVKWVASILQSDGQLSSLFSSHVRHSNLQQSLGEVCKPNLEQKASHFNQCSGIEYFWWFGFDESACLSSIVPQIVFIANSHDFCMFSLHWNLQTANCVGISAANLERALSHDVKSS